MRFPKNLENMRRKKILVFPHLCNRRGDLSKKWYVELSMRNPQTNEMLRQRVELYEGTNINDLPTANERIAVAEKIIVELKQKIANGWTIFNDMEECVYDDQMQYSHVAAVYNEKINSTENYTYWVSRYIENEFPKRQLKPGTIATNKSRYRVFGNWLKSKQYNQANIQRLNNDVIVDFFLFLRDTRKIAKRTHRSYAELLFTFFDYVRKNGGIVENPVYDLPKNRIVKDMAAVRIQAIDVNMLMTELDEHDAQLALACRFEYYCGLRPGHEVRLLRVGDIDLQRGKVLINYDNAKTTTQRSVTIPDVFVNYLAEVWKLDTYPDDHYIFSRKGKPGTFHLGKNNLRFRFVRYRKKLKLPDEYKFYSFKHTGAITLAEHGETLINIRDHLRHTTIAATEHYLRRHGFYDSKIIKHEFPKI